VVRSEPTPRQDGLWRTESTYPADLYGSDEADRPGFAVLTVSVDGEVVVAVRGEIDMATAPQLWQCLQEAIPEVTDRLVVDLAETTFMDSTALNVLVRACKRLRHSEGELVVRAPSKTTRKVLAVSGLDVIMTIEG
jgi:anti-sigma B factor antagonist